MKYIFKIILSSLLTLVLFIHCESDSSGRKIKLRAPQQIGTSNEDQSSTAILKIEPEKRRSIAIFYFENLTGDGSLDWMQRGIAEMLVTSLSQSRYLDVIALERVYSLLRKMGQTSLPSLNIRFASALAQEANVESVLTGRLRKEGEELVVEAELYEAGSGKLVGTEKVSGRMEHAFTMVDELSRNVKSGLRLQYEKLPEIDAPLSNITTNSIKAYEYYNKGRWYSERLDEKNTIIFLEKAIEVDPQFALAYAELSDQYLIAGDDLKSVEAIEKAMQFLDRASAIDQQYIQGAKALNDLDFDLAIEKFQRVIAADSNRFDAYIRLGSVYLDQQEFEKANHVLELARIQNEFSPIVQVLIGISYLYSGDMAKAREQLSLANELNPNSAISKILLGTIYWMTGRARDAANEFRAALEMQPHNLRALINLGVLYSQLEGNNHAAIQLLKRGLEVCPNSSMVLAVLGRIYRAVGRYDEALDVLNRAAALNPRLRPNVLLLTAFVYLRLQDDKEVQNLIEEVLELAPDSASIRCSISEAFLAEEMLSDAQSHVEIALQQRPDLLCGLSQRASVLSSQGRHKETIEMLRKILEISPNSVSHKRWLAWKYSHLDRFEEALALGDSCLLQDPSNVNTYYLMHWIYSELGLHRQALDIVKQANEFIPSYAQGYLLQGETYLHLDQWEEAEQAFEKMLAFTSDSLIGEEDIARVLLEQNQVSKAMTYLNHVVKKRPEEIWTHCSLANGLKHGWQLQEAIEEYRKALAIKPDDIACLRELGHTLCLAGRYKEARKTYLDYAKKNLSQLRHSYAERWIAMSYAHAGQYRKALKHLDKTYDLARKDDSFRMTQEALASKAILLHESGQHENAIQLYQKVLTNDPDADWIRAAMGCSFLAVNDTSKVQTVIDTLQNRLQRGAPKTHVRYIYELKAERYLLEGKSDSATYYARKALAVRRNRKHYYQYLLARCLFNSGNADSTILLCDDILKSVDNNFFFVYIRPKTRLLKAKALAQINQSQQAMQECEMVLNQFQKADKDLEITRMAEQLYTELRKGKITLAQE